MAERGGNVKLLEGYGLTEAVTGDHGHAARRVPRRLDRHALSRTCWRKICAPAPTTKLPPGEEGEICVAGPAVMLGYLDDPEATRADAARARRRPHLAAHRRPRPDGRRRLLLFHGAPEAHDQVLGLQRLSGAGRGRAATSIPLVAEACVVGVPDPAQVERVQGLRRARRTRRRRTRDTEQALIAHCRERLIKWSCPREIEFRARAAEDARRQDRLQACSCAEQATRDARQGRGMMTMDKAAPCTAATASRRRCRRTACASCSRCAAGTSRRSSSPPRRAASASSTRATRRPRCSPPTRSRA